MEWEYLLRRTFMNEDDLNNFGENEWELVSVVPDRQDSYGFLYFFKRPVEDYEEDENGEGEGGEDE